MYNIRCVPNKNITMCPYGEHKDVFQLPEKIAMNVLRIPFIINSTSRKVQTTSAFCIFRFLFT